MYENQKLKLRYPFKHLYYFQTKFAQNTFYENLFK